LAKNPAIQTLEAKLNCFPKLREKEILPADPAAVINFRIFFKITGPVAKHS
jgi:hypothetical protein